MNILFIGDIVGRPGRELVRLGLRALVRGELAQGDSRERAVGALERHRVLLG